MTKSFQTCMNVSWTFLVNFRCYEFARCTQHTSVPDFFTTSLPSWTFIYKQNGYKVYWKTSNKTTLAYLEFPCFTAYFEKFIHRFNETLIMIIAHPFDVFIMDLNPILQLFHELLLILSIIHRSTVKRNNRWILPGWFLMACIIIGQLEQRWMR